MSHLGKTFWLEALVGAFSVLLLVVTVIWPDWMELVLHIDPDAGNGAAEWAVLAVCAVIAALSIMLARLEWRKTRVVART